MRMRDEVDVGTLTRELVTVVEETIQPAHISVAKNHPLFGGPAGIALTDPTFQPCPYGKFARPLTTPSPSL